MKTLSRTFSVPLASILLALAGCVDLTGVTGAWDCCGAGGAGAYSYPLSLTYIDNMLSGDTARISAWSTQGDPKSTWELTGPAVFVLDSHTVDTQIVTPVDLVTIRGTGTGEVNLKVVRASKMDSVTATFFVTDSANVTLRVAGSKDRRVGVGGEAWIA